MNVQQLAEQCQGYLTRKTRNNGESFVHTTESAPDWFIQLVYDCHDGLLPNDWSYFAIESAIDDLAGGCEDPEPNTSESRKWFYEYPYSEEFAENAFYNGAQSLSECLNWGMYEYFSEVFYLVQNTLEKQAEEMEAGYE